MTKEELIKNKRIAAISLGCDKNRVDLEHMLGRLKEYGFTITDDVYDSEIVIVNTCAFISPATEDSLANIFEMEALKAKGNIEKIVVTGCLIERYRDELKSVMPKIDAFVRLRENEDICEVVEKLYGVEKSKAPTKFERVLTTSASYAYLKIADGCNNVCSYCTIPRIRGRYKSVSMEDLVAEAKNLVKRGIKEIILVAQDTTRYGEDLYKKNCLIELCDKLSAIKGLEWIRLHYLYPEKISDELLEYINKNPKMCKYLDIPLQHIDDEILTSMRRKLNEDGTRKLIDKIHRNYPDFALRSTFIVGYPNENRKKFKKLLEFLEKTKIDYAGFFPYSREEGTVSFYLPKQVSAFTKKRRLKKAQKLQNAIMSENARQLIGQETLVLVDYFDENTGEYVAHNQKLAPSVDFEVRFVDNGYIEVAQFVKVKIYDFDGRAYKGEIIWTHRIR